MSKHRPKIFNVEQPDRHDFNIMNPSRDDVSEVYIPTNQALKIIFKQMRATGRRNRTIESYDYIFNKFVESMNITYVQEISAETIYEYIDSLEVSTTTKLIRLKSIKAVLSRFYDNGWFDYKFWSSIQITVDSEVKEGTEENDIALLLNSIDKTTFAGFRDAVAILFLYKTGVRITTLAKLKNKHIDFDAMEINLDASIQKGRSLLRLPMDRQLADNIQRLMIENKRIREFYKKDNDYLFITFRGTSVLDTKSKTNAISKQLTYYGKTFGLKNINAHSIRRAYAKNLLNQGANIALISKALGHKDLSTTTRYLHLDLQEVSDNLREYL